MQLLTVGNPKVLKGRARNYLTGILHLSPWKAAGVNVCPMAELAGCVAGCLNTADRGGIAAGAAVTAPHGVTVPDNAIQAARIRKTRAFHENRGAFMAALVKDVAALVRKAERDGLTPTVRLNGTSDIRWESIPVYRGLVRYDSIMAAFPAVQFYDYTKIANRDSLPSNYHLTFSASGRPEFGKFLDRAMLAGMNVAAVFKGALPETFMGRPVVDGDMDDLRFLDPAGVVVGLKAKGRAKRDTSGFVFA